MATAKTRIKITWRKGAFAELRTLPGVMKEIDDTTKRMAQRAGKDYEAKPATATRGRVRGRGAVVATGGAVRDNAKNHTLARVLAQGGG